VTKSCITRQIDKTTKDAEKPAEEEEILIKDRKKQ